MGLLEIIGKRSLIIRLIDCEPGKYVVQRDTILLVRVRFEVLAAN